MTGKLERLGSALAEETVPREAKETKESLLTAVAAKMDAAKRRRRLRLSVLGAAAAILALLGALFYSVSPGPEDATTELRCTMDGASLAEGAWMDLRKEPGSELIFEGAGRMTAAMGTRLRLSDLDANDVRLTLESGDLTFDLDHKLGRTWRIDAGPYRVTVVGTRFDLDWNPAEQAIRVAVRRGAVEISGEELTGRAMLVRAGEEFTSTPGSQHLIRRKEEPLPREEVVSANEPTKDEEKTPDPALSRESQALSPEKTAQKVAAKKKDPKTTSENAREPSWSELANQERYLEAVQAAEAMGYEALLGTLDADALLRLADVARLAGRSMRSQQALMELRVRFRGHPGRLAAAFRLGRINYDQQRYSEAVEWFETYVGEAEGRGLTAEARGRLIDLWIKLNDNSKANRAAEEYLKHHHGGNYTALAQQVLADP